MGILRLTLFLGTFLVALDSGAAEIAQCCPDNNTLARGKCIDGSNVTVLTCHHKYTAKRDEYKYDAALGGLEADGTIIPEDKFCVSRYKGKDVYLVCFPEHQEPEEERILVKVVSIISVFFLVITLAIYFITPELLDLEGICLVNFMIGEAVGFINLGVLNFYTNVIIDELCQFYAYLGYFSMLYAFFWLNVLSFHIWRITVKPLKQEPPIPWKLIYYLFGVGGPIIFLIILTVSQHTSLYMSVKPEVGESKCWIGTMKAQMIYFYGPISVLLIINAIYYVWTISVLWREVRNVESKRTKILKYRLKMCLKLAVVMGITWVFEVISAALMEDYPSPFWDIPDLINALQGVFIFIILVLLRKRVLRLLAQKSPCRRWIPNKWRTLEDEEDEAGGDLKADANTIPMSKGEEI
uniref:G-protein coupled receptor Mth-like protein 2 n=1 Tax=Dastarcus helophoroides TaxID=1169899 RepID=A0A0A7P814_9CUCU|nr:G-protein coupled receptor Mth-like protein 2 [Dastarcus helophoroides]